MTEATNGTRPTRSGLLGIMERLAPGRRRRQVMQATWRGIVIAESEDTVLLEGNHYFPAAAVEQSVLRPTAHQTLCPWKGIASYHDIAVGGDVTRNGAWYYAKPTPLARNIAGRVAFSSEVAVHLAEQSPSTSRTDATDR
jgi:uncharacterized protein (DUF427 family)